MTTNLWGGGNVDINYHQKIAVMQHEGRKLPMNLKEEKGSKLKQIIGAFERTATGFRRIDSLHEVKRTCCSQRVL